MMIADGRDNVINKIAATESYYATLLAMIAIIAQYSAKME
jgi:hypothetical protein